MSIGRGFVYIVGAGPGNPDLITVRGLRIVETSDIILHDRLVHSTLIHAARSDAVVMDVGKREGFEDEEQAAIHRLMIDYANEGRIVCRLKGGDPFVFGRGAEEVSALVQADIPFEVIPGVSSAFAAPGAAGIPLTHRDHSHGFLVIAGSRSNKLDSPEWSAACSLLNAGGTLVVLMGLARLPLITQFLLSNGCDINLSAAIISRASWPDEEIRYGSVSTISLSSEDLLSPAVFIAGNVVGLGKQMHEMTAQICQRTTGH